MKLDNEYEKYFEHSSSQYWELLKNVDFRSFDDKDDLLAFKRDLFKFTSAFLDDLFSLTDLLEAKVNHILERAESEPYGLTKKDCEEIALYFHFLRKNVDTRQN